MRFRLMLVLTGIFAAAGLFTTLPAHAFTMESGDASGPKFDLDEQVRQFGAAGRTSTAAGQNQFQTPLGQGTLQFGVQQGPTSSFSTFGSSTTTRRDFDRVVTPENLR